VAEDKKDEKEPSKELTKPGDDFFNVVAVIKKTNPNSDQKKRQA
jgi:hypothetical protein